MRSFPTTIEVEAFILTPRKRGLLQPLKVIVILSFSLLLSATVLNEQTCKDC